MRATTAHTTIRQHAERSVPGEQAAILAAGLVAHVGFVENGRPIVLPMSYHFDPARPDRLWLHGARNSRLLAHAASGAPLCVSVTIVDGLVRSKSAKSHSMNYRSAVVFGRGRAVTDAEGKAALFARLVARYFPGRTAGRNYAPPSAGHLEATALVELVLDAGSAKARRGGPGGPGDDAPDGPGDAGVDAAPSALPATPRTDPPRA